MVMRAALAGVIHRNNTPSVITYADYPLLTDLNDTSIYGNVATYSPDQARTVIQDSAAGVIDYASGQPAFAGASGIQNQRAHTNQFWPSRDYTNANWIKGSNTTLTTGQSSPDGQNGATRITTTTTLSAQLFQAVTGSGKRYISCIVSPGNIDYVIILVSNAGSTSRLFQWINIRTGTAESLQYIGTGTSLISCNIISLGSGFYEVGLEVNTTYTPVNISFLSARVNATTGSLIAGDYINIWQSDTVNAAGVYSPVLTTTAPVTYVKDQVSIPASHFPTNNFTITMSPTISYPETTTYFYAHMTDLNNGIYAYWYNGEFIAVIARGGVFQDARVTSTLVAGTQYDITISMSDTAGLTLDVDGTSDTDATSLADLPASAATALLWQDESNGTQMTGRGLNFQVVDL